jgi:hypothetical protein
MGKRKLKDKNFKQLTIDARMPLLSFLADGLELFGGHFVQIGKDKTHAALRL